MVSNSNTCEVGISDHHHLVSKMLNKKNCKGSTITLFYRGYKKFEENKFAKDLTRDLEGRRMRIAQIYACVLLYFLLKAVAFDVLF